MPLPSDPNRCAVDERVHIGPGPAPKIPWMEREVEAACAHSKEEIIVAVEACWDRLTPDILQKVAARVRRNAQNTFDLKGGNFYSE